MISNSDLKLVLPLNQVKRITDINGLSLIVRSGKKGMSYIFTHRMSYKSKTITVSLNTKSLREARKIALERIENIEGIFSQEKTEKLPISLYELFKDYLKYLERQGLAKNTLTKFYKHYNKYFEPRIRDITIEQITPKLLFNTFLKEPLENGYYETVRYLQIKLIACIDLARINYPTMNIQDIRIIRRLYKMPKEESHFPCVPTINIVDVLSIQSCSLPTKCLLELSFNLLLRPSEMVNIKLEDIDFTNNILTVPRTKTTTNFRVPLTTQSLLIIYLAKHLKKDKNNPYLFEGVNQEHKNSQTLNQLIKRNGFKGSQTAHSIRALGRTWMEENGIRYEVAESCLSHKVGNDTYRAYVRTDYFEERINAMKLWSNHLSRILGLNSVLNMVID